jgi:hemoglobin
MKPDIKNRADIEKLVNVFYDKIKTDTEIGYFFTEVAKVDWEKHLPIMYNFWENILFSTGNFEGNPMLKHKDLHQKSKLNPAHFLDWNTLFNDTVDELFTGDRATEIKQRAKNIAAVMMTKALE